MNRIRRTVEVAAVAAIVGVVVGCAATDRDPEVAARGIAPQEATSAPAAADVLLASRLRAALETDLGAQQADIQVSVSQGRARLSGFVSNAAARLRAADLARQAEGIVAVDNRLILRHHAEVGGPLKDVRVLL